MGRSGSGERGGRAARGRARDGGFTLVEVVIAVGIVATTVATGVGLSLASRSFAVAATATEFDHLLDSARTIARQTQGATLAFVPDAYGDGTEVRVLAGTPEGPPVPTTLPPLHARAAIEEVESLGKPPFAFIVHVSGALGGRSNFRIGNTSASREAPCPASGAFHFVIRAGGGSADRYVPCRTVLASNGPATLMSWPAAQPAASPTPCGGACTTAPLPTPPSSSPTCPPNYAPIANGCAAPPTPNTGPHYHVSAAGASPTVNVGGSTSFTAQATLTNPGTVPAGTPASVPVVVQQSTPGICTASPPGPQPSGTPFAINAIAPGTCIVTMQADLSAVPGASADSANIAVSVPGSSTSTPTPAPCDLVQNGQCYHRIVDQTAKLFTKYVNPATQCADLAGAFCWYIDAVRDVALRDAFIFIAPTPPIDQDHELLFQIDQVQSVDNDCVQFLRLAGLPPGNPLPSQHTGIGGPVGPPSGIGEPSRYITINHVIGTQDQYGAPLFAASPWPLPTTLADLYESVAFRRVSSPMSFTYYSGQAATAPYVAWSPDFPGCDSAGDAADSGPQFGGATVEVIFDVYQK